MTAKKKSTIIVIAVVVVLIAAIAVLAIINMPKGEVDSSTLSIVSGGETLKTFSLDEIKALEYSEVHKKIVSSSYEDTEGTFRGVWLSDIIDAVDPALKNSASQIIARSEDAFVASYTVEDVFDSDDIMLVYMFDGEELGNLKSGGTGPYRIIIMSDEFGNRSAKYVYELEVR